MDIWRRLFGSAFVEIVSADVSGILNHINHQGITIEDISLIDPVTCRFAVHWADLKKLNRLIQKRSDSIKIVKRKGSYWTIKSSFKRPVLVLGMLFFLLCLCYLPGKVYFIQVVGNEQIPAEFILEKAEACGIGFGATRSVVRSEKVKNALLDAIPQLQWAGINTKGCVAVISVKERALPEQQKDPNKMVCSIVASRDGVISNCTANAGNLLCRVGQAVRKGETLISGYTDCGLTIQAVRAEGEIYAITHRNLKLISPLNGYRRGEYLSSRSYYAIKIGKKYIKFNNSSGISDATCVKIYDKYPLTLPGGFVLPITLIKETYLYYDISFDTTCKTNDLGWVDDYANTYLCSQMVAGKILFQSASQQLTEDVCIYSGQYACLEMIGKSKLEEIIR